MNEVITRIEKLEPHPTEAIVMHFNPNNTHFDLLKWTYDVVKSQFPNNVVVAIPDSVALESFSKDVLENIISEITEVIEQLYER